MKKLLASLQIVLAIATVPALYIGTAAPWTVKAVVTALAVLAILTGVSVVTEQKQS